MWAFSALSSISASAPAIPTRASVPAFVIAVTLFDHARHVPQVRAGGKARAVSGSEGGDSADTRVALRRFSQKESVASHSQVKSSVARGIRNGIMEALPYLDPIFDELLPKKAPLFVAKVCVQCETPALSRCAAPIAC